MQDLAKSTKAFCGLVSLTWNKCLNKTTKIQSERIIIHFETDLIQIWLQTGFKQQVLVDVFGEMVGRIVGYGRYQAPSVCEEYKPVSWNPAPV